MSRLLKSWATPPAKRPTASIFCAWRSLSSRATRSVTSCANDATPSTRPDSSTSGVLYHSQRNGAPVFGDIVIRASSATGLLNSSLPNLLDVRAELGRNNKARVLPEGFLPGISEDALSRRIQGRDAELEIPYPLPPVGCVQSGILSFCCDWRICFSASLRSVMSRHIPSSPTTSPFASRRKGPLSRDKPGIPPLP